MNYQINIRKSKIHVLLILMVCLGILSGCSFNDKEVQSSSQLSEKQVMCYITNIDSTQKTITYDEIEWITQYEIEKINELELDEVEDFPNGYYIYNESKIEKKLKVSDTAEIYTLETPNYTTLGLTDFEELESRFIEAGFPYNITISKNIIISISEVYIP